MRRFRPTAATVTPARSEEKIKRDVRITTIYEGTSEIMEMTIARDRWQEHLKSRGHYYHDAAEHLDALHNEHGDVGADVAALAMHSLADIFEFARLSRLTRNQHILLRFGELVAWAESADTLARRAARALDGRLPEKGDTRFKPVQLATISRVYARKAALKVATDGLALLAGSIEHAAPQDLPDALQLPAIYRAQSGLLSDMNAVADALYGRDQD